MSQPLRSLGLATTLALAGLLGACTTVQTVSANPGATGDTAPLAKPSEPVRPIAGSRLPAATTDRMVKQIGAAGARDMVNDKPGNPGRAAN